MLGVFFEGWVFNEYDFYDVVGSVYKYVHCDLMNALRYFTIMLTMGFTFVTTFFGPFKYMAYIKVSKFGVMFKNKFEKGV